MAVTFTKIATTTVTSGTPASIGFSSIPSTYSDLMITQTLRGNRGDLAADGAYVRFNNDTTAGNYQNRRLIGVGNSGNASADLGSGYGGGALPDAALASANVFGSGTLYIPDYLNALKKVWFTRGGAGNRGATNYQMMSNGWWSSTSAINQIDLYNEVGTAWIVGSTMTLYGIKRG